MPPNPTLIITHAPTWVWGLLTLLLVLGLSQARDRLVRTRTATVLPVVMLVLSLNAVSRAFGLVPATLGAWALGVAVAAAVAHLAGWPKGITWNTSHRRLFVPGSWVPLATFMALFALKFGIGAAMAVHADVTTDPLFAPAAALACGAFSGVFLCRGLAMWRAVPGDLGRLQPSA